VKKFNNDDNDYPSFGMLECTEWFLNPCSNKNGAGYESCLANGNNGVESPPQTMRTFEAYLGHILKQRTRNLVSIETA
jgi:hypothetical protein